MDRTRFGDWGRELGDDDFLRALLGAGLVSKTPLAWSRSKATAPTMPRFAWSHSMLEKRIRSSHATALSTWLSVEEKYHTVTLISQFLPQFNWAYRCEVITAFQRLASVRAVTIECMASWAISTPWRLPIGIGALLDDEVAAWFTERNRWSPPNWPFRYRTVSRQFDRYPFLVANAPLDRIESLFDAAPPRLKANALLVNGLGFLDESAIYETLTRIAARWSLSGIALVRDALSSADFASNVHVTALELTHNLPLDASLRAAFGDNVVLIGNESLLNEARVGAQLQSLDSKLASLPKSASLRLAPRNASMLSTKARIAMSAPPDEVTAAAAPEPQVMVKSGSLRSAIKKSAPSFGFVGESHEATALTELSESVRELAATSAEHTVAARRVQQQSAVRAGASSSFEPVTDGYALCEAVRMRIRIGSASDSAWQSSDVDFPDRELPPNESSHRLTVMLHEPTYVAEPQLRDIELPRSGASTEAEFHFTPTVTGTFEARATILHRGRVLQTAMIRVGVYASRAAVPSGATMHMWDETRVRADWTSLDRRARFDLAFVCNRDDEHIPRLTGVADAPDTLAGALAWSLDLTRVDASVTRINGLLSDAASHVIDHGDGLDQGANPELLSNLAFAGRELFLNLLHEQLRTRAAGSLDLRSDTVSHIQIVGTRVDELVPIEFIYDYPLSAFDVEPAVCPKYREGLERGECPGECAARRAAGEHICPNGFWGVRKVIERHLFNAAAEGREAAIVAAAEANVAHDTLAIREHVAIGHSERVKAPTIAPLINALRTKLGDRVTTVADWKEWVTAVETHAPSWLIAFPHNDGSGDQRRLELGGKKIRTVAFAIHDEAITLADPTVDYFVRVPGKPPPLVFLLGCDTAGALDDSGSHLDAFRRGGAALIVSTVATVFGEHAVAMGESIAKALLALDADASNEKRFGEVLRDAKRKALLESLPMALGIVAFGDAEWRIV